MNFKEFCQLKNKEEKSVSRYWHGAESHELINLTVSRLFDRAAEYIDWKLDERNNKL